MATVWFTERPDVRNGVQWTGDNLAELETWAAEQMPYILPITDNQDDTITCTVTEWTLSVGDWLTTYGPLTDEVMGNMDVVPGEPPFHWGITGT